MCQCAFITLEIYLFPRRGSLTGTVTLDRERRRDERVSRAVVLGSQPLVFGSGTGWVDGIGRINEN